MFSKRRVKKCQKNPKQNKNKAGTRKQGASDFLICGSSNAYVQSPIWPTDMRICLKLPKGLHYMVANSKVFGETALMRRLALIFAGRLCDKYPFLMCWLKY